MPKRKKYLVDLSKDCLLMGGHKEYPHGATGLEIQERYVEYERLFALRFPKEIRKKYRKHVERDGTILVPRWVCKEIKPERKSVQND